VERRDGTRPGGVARGDGATTDSRTILAGHDLFRSLSPTELDRVLALARVETYRPRETIFLKGSEGRGLLAVLQGRVQIRSPGIDGREIILNLIEPGGVFGEIALLDGRERSADAVAMTRCKLLVIERRDFVPFLRQNPEATLSLMTILCDKLRRTTEQVEDIMFLDLPSRLAKSLLSLSKGDAGAGGGKRAEIDLSQRTLGNVIGFTRESVNKQLAQWQKDGIVALADGRIAILDAAALERYAAGTGLDLG
jgi:CRP/FNR family cyclic AMP-dependent transcriptional regulator